MNKTSFNDTVIDLIWSIKGSIMELTKLQIQFDVFYDDDSLLSDQWSLNVLVTPPKRRIDRIFYIIVPFVVIFISILMGILLDTKVILGIVNKPTSVLVGFVAQYGLMPFLAMAIAKLFRYNPLNSLALFVIGCCPGNVNKIC